MTAISIRMATLTDIAGILGPPDIVVCRRYK